MLDLGLIHVTRPRNREDEVNVVVPHFHTPEPCEISYDNQNSSAMSLVICLPGPMSYAYDKAIPYKYNAIMLDDGKEVLIPSLSSVVNIADVSGVIRSGQVYASPVQKKNNGVVSGKQV